MTARNIGSYWDNSSGIIHKQNWGDSSANYNANYKTEIGVETAVL